MAEKVSVKANKCDWQKASDNLQSEDYWTAVEVGAATYVATSVITAAYTTSIASALTSTAFTMDGCVFCIAAAAVAAIVYLVVEEANKCDGNIPTLPDYIINLSGKQCHRPSARCH